MTNGIKGIQGFQSRPVPDRFWEKVNKDGPLCVRLGTKCWVWMGGTYLNGYGCIKIKRHMVSVHRLSWQLANGEIPEGMFVLHKCDNRPCVNPDHLFLGTQQDNVDDMITKGRRPSNSVAISGEHNGRHKLTSADAIAIRERFAGGETGPSLAADFHVSKSAVYRIVERRRWLNVK
jgi:hypothetical protein